MIMGPGVVACSKAQEVPEYKRSCGSHLLTGLYTHCLFQKFFLVSSKLPVFPSPSSQEKASTQVELFRFLCLTPFVSNLAH